MSNKIPKNDYRMADYGVRDKQRVVPTGNNPNTFGRGGNANPKALGNQGKHAQYGSNKVHPDSKKAAALVEGAAKKTGLLTKCRIKFFTSLKALWNSKIIAGLKRVVTKVGGKLLTFFGLGAAIIGYVLKTSSLSHATVSPVWLGPFRVAHNSYKRSNDPVIKLECLRKMYIVLYKNQKRIDDDFAKSLFAAGLVYKEEVGLRDELVNRCVVVSDNYRQTVFRSAAAMQPICSAAKLLIHEAQESYSRNQDMIRRIKWYSRYFLGFERLANSYMRLGSMILPNRAAVITELAKNQSLDLLKEFRL